MGSEEKITSLNGNLYFQIFVSGANKILENQKLLNKINVFPVADADTGTNLASTLRAVIDNARPSDSYKVTANSIAIAALNGARGNPARFGGKYLTCCWSQCWQRNCGACYYGRINYFL